MRTPKKKKGRCENRRALFFLIWIRCYFPFFVVLFFAGFFFIKRLRILDGLQNFTGPIQLSHKFLAHTSYKERSGIIRFACEVS
jgi:hypothetical protein